MLETEIVLVYTSICFQNYKVIKDKSFNFEMEFFSLVCKKSGLLSLEV